MDKFLRDNMGMTRNLDELAIVVVDEASDMIIEDKGPISTEEINMNEDGTNVDDTSDSELFNVLVDSIKSFGLSIDDIRGQGYDNGSNMKGK
ncbi:hypothetical protein OsJ_02093 [Oryza sativa Japonica Group]|uniref:DUF4371 domain-containing protein n=1 Tax=Oryza sativa subsp. japonica TaxID=39947 RepID=A2ZU11_ORYSJ|nr:hypothetical protein OsJ_02093 [Oryza sativa Japonica Group]